jgi:hypothetical protein
VSILQDEQEWPSAGDLLEQAAHCFKDAVALLLRRQGNARSPDGDAPRQLGHQPGYLFRVIAQVILEHLLGSLLDIVA